MTEIRQRSETVVLIVNDFPELADALRHSLEREGFATLAAREGAGALALAGVLAAAACQEAGDDGLDPRRFLGGWFPGDDILQIELARSTAFDDDPEVAAMETVECREGEEFPEPDTDEDEEDWDPDAWTPEKCWTVYWAPLGRAIRVVDPGVLTALIAEGAL